MDPWNTILSRYQPKTLRLIAQAPWFIMNTVTHHHLNIPLVKKNIIEFNSRYVY